MLDRAWGPIPPPSFTFHSTPTREVYNRLVDTIPKVPKRQFDAILSKLLNTPPLPLAAIGKKRDRKTKTKKLTH